MVALLQLPEVQLIDANGNPLVGAAIHTYIPTTTTPKTTWSNSGGTVANTNPIITNSAGRAIIWGDGQYRCVINDALGNLIYDQVAAAGGNVETVTTIAALRLYNFTGGTTLMVVEGYASTSDGCGGVFTLAVGSSAADNGGTLIVDAAGNRWARVYSGPPSVKYWGAQGGGIIDDTTAIQAAFTAVAVTGGPIAFEGCAYLISSAITLTAGNITIYGNGSEIITNSSTAHVFTIGTVANVAIDNLHFYDLRVWATAPKSAGAAWRGTASVTNSSWHNCQAGNLTLYAAAAAHRLYNGWDLSGGALRVVLDEDCVGVVAHYGVIVCGNATTSASAEAEVNARLIYCNRGVYCGGAYGGLYVGGEISVCQTGVLIDKVLVATINREIFLMPAAIIDSCGDYSVHVVADSVAILDITGSWMTSAAQVTAGGITPGAGVGLYIEQPASVPAILKCVGARFYNNVTTGAVVAGAQGLIGSCEFNTNGAGLIVETASTNWLSVISCKFLSNTGAGLTLTNSADNFVIEGNTFSANGSAITGASVAWSATQYIRNNAGYISRGSGSATITSGTTSVTFSHGLVHTPTAIVISTNDTGHTYAVGTVTSTQITVNASAAPGSNITVWWMADNGPWS